MIQVRVRILDFSRQAVLERRPVALRPFLAKQIGLLARTLPESITVELSGADEECAVNADPTRLQQVVMNLAVNARDAWTTNWRGWKRWGWPAGCSSRRRSGSWRLCWRKRCAESDIPRLSRHGYRAPSRRCQRPLAGASRSASRCCSRMARGRTP